MKELIATIISAIIDVSRKIFKKRVDPKEFEEYKKITDQIVVQLEKYSCITLDCNNRQKIVL